MRHGSGCRHRSAWHSPPGRTTNLWSSPTSTNSQRIGICGRTVTDTANPKEVDQVGDTTATRMWPQYLGFRSARNRAPDSAGSHEEHNVMSTRSRRRHLPPGHRTTPQFQSVGCAGRALAVSVGSQRRGGPELGVQSMRSLLVGVSPGDSCVLLGPRLVGAGRWRLFGAAHHS